MSDGTEGSRGADTWHAQRAEIAKRNVDARKRGKAERRTRELAVELRARAEAARELQEIEALNASIDKRRVDA